MANYISQQELILLLSIKKPRRITTSEELVALRRLATQDLVHFGVTLNLGKSEERYTIPTARLTDYAHVVLRYMQHTMLVADWDNAVTDAAKMTAAAEQHLAAVCV